MKSPRFVAVAAVLALSAAAPAWAHDGQDRRPGAVRVDLEVLLSPPVNGETSPGGHDASVAVDPFNNVYAGALKELPASPDSRATAKARLGSWRWSSGDDGVSFQDLQRTPAGFDVLVPGGISTAVGTDDAGHGFAVEAHGGLALLTQTTATTQDDVVTDTTVPLAVGTGAPHKVRIDATGDATTTGRLYLLATSTTSPGDPAVWSGTTASPAGTSVTLPGSSLCSLAADHRKGSRTVVAACKRGTATTLWTSRDAGATFTALALPSSPADAPSASIGPDGTAWVLVTTTAGRIVVHRVPAKGTVTTQDLSVGKGTWRGAALDVSKLGRLGLAAYYQVPGTGQWHVLVAITSPGKTPVWVDFASHDPVSLDTTPPDDAPAVAFGPDNRLHLVWGSTKVTAGDSPTRVLRNVWSVRTLST